MSRQRQLARAPLREAIIDLQLMESLPSSFVESLAEKTLPGYERRQPIRQFSLNLGSAGPTVTGTTEQLLGWRFESPDGSRIAQLRNNGMGYSFVKEYTKWTEIKAAAQQTWESYRSWAGDITVSRIAVRYINVLELPIGAELNHYLTAAPQIPQGLPQTLTYFLERIVVPFDHGITATITQMTEPSGQAEMRIILDIDVVVPRSFGGGSLELWACLDQLREVKNAVFFSSVTEQTLENYE